MPRLEPSFVFCHRVVLDYHSQCWKYHHGTGSVNLLDISKRPDIWSRPEDPLDSKLHLNAKFEYKNSLISQSIDEL